MVLYLLEEILLGKTGIVYMTDIIDFLGILIGIIVSDMDISACTDLGI